MWYCSVLAEFTSDAKAARCFEGVVQAERPEFIEEKNEEP